MTTQNPGSNGQAPKQENKINVGSLRPTDLNFAPKINITAPQLNLQPPKINCQVPNQLAQKKPTLQPPTSLNIHIAPGMMIIAPPKKPGDDKKGQQLKNQAASDKTGIKIEPDSPFEKSQSDLDVVNQVENMMYNKSDSFNPNPTMN